MRIKILFTIALLLMVVLGTQAETTVTINNGPNWPPRENKKTENGKWKSGKWKVLSYKNSSGKRLLLFPVLFEFVVDHHVDAQGAACIDEALCGEP